MELKGKNFELRHIRLEDAKPYFECQQDKAAKKGFMRTLDSLSQAKKEIIRRIKSLRKKKPTEDCFSIIVDGKFAGFVILNHLNQKYKWHYGNIGYCIDKKFRGRGIATAAVKLVARYAFKKYNLKRLEATCRTFNKASARVLEKSGFKFEGILRKNKWKDGKYLDDMVWAIVK